MKKIFLMSFLLPVCFAVFSLAPSAAKAADPMGGIQAYVKTLADTPIPGATVKMEGSGGNYFYVGLGTIPCSSGAIVYDGSGLGDGDQATPWSRSTDGNGFAGFWGIPPFDSYGASCQCNVTITVTAPGYYTETFTFWANNNDGVWNNEIVNNGDVWVTFKLTPIPVCESISMREGRTGPTLLNKATVTAPVTVCKSWYTNAYAKLRVFKNGVSLFGPTDISYSCEGSDGGDCDNWCNGYLSPTETVTWEYQITPYFPWKGSGDTCAVTYTVVPSGSPPPPPLTTNTCPTLEADPPSVKQGDPVKLTWTPGENVKKIDIKQKPTGSTMASIFYPIAEGSPQISGGSIDVIPSVSTTYILDAEFLSGTPATCSTADVPVNVRPSQTGGDRPVPPN